MSEKLNETLPTTTTKKRNPKVKPIAPDKPNINKDLDFDLADQIINSLDDTDPNIDVEHKTFNAGLIESLTNSAQNREQVYQIIDSMAQDDAVATIVEQYVSDICEGNEQGQVIWVECDDSVQNPKYFSWLLKSLNIEDMIMPIAYDLVTYGDVYVRLPRKSEVEIGVDYSLNPEKQTLNESTYLYIVDRKNDHYAGFLDKVDNPGEMYDLTRFGKNQGYIKVPVTQWTQQGDGVFNVNNGMYRMKPNRDAGIYDPSCFVHAYLTPTSQRQPEVLEIYNTTEDSNGKDQEYALGVYKIKRGQSMLFNAFRVWRELNLLEMSALLNRLTQSSVVRIITVEVGDMSKTKVEAFLHKLKSKIEQHIALDSNSSMQDFAGATPIINSIYVPVKEKQGQINIQSLGGDFDPKSLTDIEYFRDKFYGAMGVPKQFFGHTEDGAGFNGGTSLTILSAQYGKRVKKYKQIICRLVRDIINLYLIDRGLSNLVNKFTVHMQMPVTQKDIDQRAHLDNELRAVSDINNMLGDVDDPLVKLKIMKISLTRALNSPEIDEILTEYINKKEEELNPKEEPEPTDNMTSEEESAPAPFEGGNESEPTLAEPESTENAPSPESNSTDILGGGESESTMPTMDEINNAEESFDDMDEDNYIITEEGVEEKLPTAESLGIGISDEKDN